MKNSSLLALALVMTTTLLVGQTPLKSPFEHVQEAILRDDYAAARQGLKDLAEPTTEPERLEQAPARALLLANSQKDSSKKVAELLAVASSWPERDEGLAAILSALSGINHLLTGGATDYEEDDDQRREASEQIQLARTLLLPWMERAGDDHRVRLGRHLLRRAEAGNRSPMGELRIGTDANIPVPGPLSHKTLIELIPLPDQGPVPGEVLDGDVLPILSTIAEAGAIDCQVKPPHAGRFLLRARNVDLGWTVTRRLLVSDLRLLYQSFPNTLVLVAELKGSPQAGVTVHTRIGSDEHTVATDEHGIAILRFEEDHEPRDVRASIQLASQKGRHLANLPYVATVSKTHLTTRHAFHLVVDRPLYRPGETVKGRIAVRRQQPSSDPSQGQSETVSFVGRHRLKVSFGAGKDLKQELETNAFGVATFEVGIPKNAKHRSIQFTLERFDEEKEKDPWVNLGTRWPAKVAEFKRPPILLTVENPSEYTLGDPAPTVTISAQWPSGTKAAGLEGTATARLGDFRHSSIFTLNSDGLASINVELPDLDLSRHVGKRVSVNIKVRAQDGQEITRSSRIRIVKPKTEVTQQRGPYTRTDLKGPISITESETWIGKVRGNADSFVLISWSTHEYLQSQIVTLNKNGEGEIAIRTTPAMHPGFQVFAQQLGEGKGQSSWARRSYRLVTVKRRSHELSVSIEPEKRTLRPGDEARVKLSVRDGNAAARKACLSVSVVDESLFLLARDKTTDPAGTFKPRFHSCHHQEGASQDSTNPLELFRNMFRQGAVEKPEYDAINDAIGVGGGAGGAFGGRGGGGQGAAPLRDEFRTTAYFNGRIMTDADGVAVLPFKLPDDLTTWRITVTAVAMDASGGMATGEVVTQLPASLSPIIPRFMRQGDQAELTLQMSLNEGADMNVQIDCTSGGTIQVAPPRLQSSLKVGEAALAKVNLRVPANAPLENCPLEFALAAADGDPLDRVQKKIPVQTEETIQVTATTKHVRGRCELDISRVEGARLQSVRLDLLGSEVLMMKQAADYLGAYPYGCAEQTVSRLTPMVLSAHSRLALGLPEGLPKSRALSPLQAHQLARGLARLRDLQKRDGGFVWWWGSQSDPAVSAIVLRTLLLMEEGGIDPRPYGVKLDAGLPILAGSVAAFSPDSEAEQAEPTPLAVLLDQVPDRSTRRIAKARCELAIIALRLRRDWTEAQRICEGIVRRGADLPTGLLARAAIALHEAGQTDLPLLALTTLKRRVDSVTTNSQLGMIDEDAAVRISVMLELLAELAPRDPVGDRLIADLMRRNRDGRVSHTAGSAAMLVSLAKIRIARNVGYATTASFDVRLIIDGKAQTVHLAAEDGACKTMELPAAAKLPITLEAPDGRLLVASLISSYAESGTKAEPVARPLIVERTMERLTIQSDGAMTREPVADSIRQGDLLEVTVTLRGPQDASFLLLESALPTGFECATQSGWLTIFDDRVARGYRGLGREGTRKLRFRVIPGMVGRFAWPPAIAEGMYRPELFGRSDGQWINVLPRVPREAVPVHLLTKDRLDQTFEDAIERLKVTPVASLPSDPQHNASSQNLKKVLALPHPHRNRWLEDEITQQIPKHFRNSGFLSAWINALPAEACIRKLRGPALTRFLDTVDPERDSLLTLSRALEWDEYNTLVMNSWGDNNRSQDEKRLDGLCLLNIRKALVPDGNLLDEMNWWLTLLEATDVEENREAISKERWLSGGFEALQAAIDDALDDRFPIRDPAHENPRSRVEVEPVLGALTTLVDRFNTLTWKERFQQVHNTPLVDSKYMAWPTSGAAEPEGHAHAREQWQTLMEGAANDLPETCQTPNPDEASDVWETLEGIQNREAVEAIATRGIETAMAANLKRPTQELWADMILRHLGRKKVKSPQLINHLMRFVNNAGPDLAATAFRRLPSSYKTDIPAETLLRRARDPLSRGWAVGTLVQRDNVGWERVQALLLPYEDRKTRLTILRFATVDQLEKLPLASFVDLMTISQEFRNSKIDRRFALALKRRTDETPELRRIAGKTGDPRTRLKLLQHLDAVGVRDIPFDEVDPEVEFYRTVWKARHGDKNADKRLKIWIFGKDDAASGQMDAPACWWGHEPHVTIEELLLASKTGHLHQVSRESISRAWNAMPTSRRLALLDEPSARGVLQKLPQEDLGCLLMRAVPLALETSKPPKNVRTVVARAKASAVLAEALPVLNHSQRASVDSFLRLCSRQGDGFHLSCAQKLLEHPSATVRERAARTVYRLTGELTDWTDAQGATMTSGPRNKDERLSALRKRLERRGLAALEGLSDKDEDLLRAHMIARGLTW